MKRLFFLIAILISAVVSVTSLQAEVLFHKNGRILKGTVVNGNSKSTTLAVTPEDYRASQIKNAKVTTQGDKLHVTVKAADIFRMSYYDTSLEKKYIYLRDGNVLLAHIAEEDSDNVIIRNDININKEQTIARSAIRTISKTKLITSSAHYTFTLTQNKANQILATRVQGAGNSVKTVAIEGDFTAWKPVDLKKENEKYSTRQEIDIIKKNQYSYRYLINGKPETQSRKIKFKLDNGNLIEEIDLMRLRAILAIGIPMPGFESTSQDVFGYSFPAFQLALQSFNPWFEPKTLGVELLMNVYSTESRLYHEARDQYFNFDITHTSFIVNPFYYWQYPKPIYGRSLSFRFKGGAGLINQSVETIGGGASASVSRQSLGFGFGFDAAYALDTKVDATLYYYFLFNVDEELLQSQVISLGVGYHL